MNIGSLIHRDTIRCQIEISSKKRALDLLSQMLSSIQPVLQQETVLSKLQERERLGSTGLGSGIAIPHCRMKNIEQAIVAFLTLSEPIDFESVDDQPVDIILCLLVPETCTDQHLQILANAATMFSDKAFCTELRQTHDDQTLHKLLNNWKTQ